MPSERTLRAQMVEVGRRLYARGLINGGEGNLSARLSERRLLCTPAGVNKGFLREEDLVVTELDGSPQNELKLPSSELLLHLACYQERADCLAVVHAHPPHAVALTLMKAPLIPCMPEAITALGEVPTAPYATPGGPAVAEAVRPLLKGADCVLMERHGALAMGRGLKSLLDACDKMEMLEGVARVQWLASRHVPPTPLPEDERRVLGEQRKRGLTRAAKARRPWDLD
ncbi:MAG: class II aldolase/adducin family protein [Deltaproteobacteria bacterium]|nr:class II aldolase/adducin family protein [Deltaproteobacteria bacterium]